MQTIQHAQAVQALKQLVHNLATQSAITRSPTRRLRHGQHLRPDRPAGLPQLTGSERRTRCQALQQQALQQQMLQQQALQQIAQYLATQQPTQFRYGLA